MGKKKELDKNNEEVNTTNKEINIINENIPIILSKDKGEKILKENRKIRKKIEYIDIMESKSSDPILSDILNNDDKILFSLNALGSLQKNEKLTEKGELLSVDDRWFLQGLRRWWSRDDRHKSANKTLIVVSAASDRITELLDSDFLSKKEENKLLNNIDTPEGKKFKETCEERRRIINKYFISLNKAKSGIENSRDTYDDKFTKNTFNLSIQRAEDILDKLQKFKGII
jgi:hypothetical protein